MKLVINGDSRSYIPPLAGRGGISQYMIASGLLAPVVNFAGMPSGKTLDYIRGNFGTDELAHAPGSAGTAYYFLFAGIHDILAGTSAASMYDDFTTIMLAARNNGFMLIGCTEPKATIFTPAQLTVCNDYNALVRGTPSICDYLLDVDAILPNASSIVDFIDGIHPTPVGAQKLWGDLAGRLP